MHCLCLEFLPYSTDLVIAETIQDVVILGLVKQTRCNARLGARIGDMQLSSLTFIRFHLRASDRLTLRNILSNLIGLLLIRFICLQGLLLLHIGRCHGYVS